MLTLTQKSEIARRNGARSRGPVTAAGKARSCRNALTHGRHASKLAEFVPPESATLSNEDRQRFFTLFDQYLVKYRPSDAVEKAIVREIAEHQWANVRIAATRQALLNRELQLHGDITIAYESAFSFQSMAALRQEYAVNTRHIARAEHRLLLLQKNWPARQPAIMDPALDRAIPEGTRAEPTQLIDSTQEPPLQHVRYSGPLTPSVIARYRKLYPHRDLSFSDRPAM